MIRRAWRWWQELREVGRAIERDYGVQGRRPEPQPDGIHVMPVPAGWTIEQAWEAVRRGDLLPTGTGGHWENIEVKDGHLVRVLPADEAPPAI